jgi:hypothetical protein
MNPANVPLGDTIGDRAGVVGLTDPVSGEAVLQTRR